MLIVCLTSYTQSTTVSNTPMPCSTSKEVKSVVSSSGQVESKNPSLSQICLACIAHGKSKAHERAQDGKLLLVSYFILHYPYVTDLTCHSRQLLADAHLEIGGCNPDFELGFHPDPGSSFQHDLWDTKNNDPDNEEDSANDSVDKRAEEIVHQ